MPTRSLCHTRGVPAHPIHDPHLIRSIQYFRKSHRPWQHIQFSFVQKKCLWIRTINSAKLCLRLQIFWFWVACAASFTCKGSSGVQLLRTGSCHWSELRSLATAHFRWTLVHHSLPLLPSPNSFLLWEHPLSLELFKKFINILVFSQSLCLSVSSYLTQTMPMEDHSGRVLWLV